MPVKVASHEHACTTLISWALTAETVDLAILVDLGGERETFESLNKSGTQYKNVSLTEWHSIYSNVEKLGIWTREINPTCI